MPRVVGQTDEDAKAVVDALMRKHCMYTEYARNAAAAYALEWLV